jgi:glutaminyl-tRNA synthetase
VKDENGEIKEIRCIYDMTTRSGGPEADRKVKGTLHWVSAKHAVKAEVRLYDRLFSDPDPAGHKDKCPEDFLNPDSLKVITGFVEPSLKDAKPLDQFQFQRLGYFNVDPDSTPGKLVFNRTVTLKDNWARND